jgi:outer membrane protein assembly factor BamA
VLFAVLAAFLALGLVPREAAATSAVDRTLRLERVVVAPPDPATEALVRRHVALAAGDPVDEAGLELVRARLEQTGYFRDVVLYTARGSEPGRVVLHVEVAPDRKVRLLTGFGYDPMDGWYLNILGARVLNRPRTGSEARLAWRSGLHVSGLYLEGSVPAGGRDRTAWLFDLHAEDQQWFLYERRESWSQTIHNRVVRLGRRAPVGPVTLAAWFGYSWRAPDDEVTGYIDAEDIIRPAGDLIDADLAGRSYLDVWLEARHDARDPSRPWWRGGWWGVRLRTSRATDGGGFFTVEADARRAWPLGAATSLATRVRAAHADDATPYHQRFPFGGVGTVRGYDFAFLSGRTGATDLAQANLELRTALIGGSAPLPRVVGLVFLDTGQCWDVEGRSRGWMAGAGWGLRVRLPWVQYLGVEVGYPLVDPGDGSPAVVNAALGWSY